MLRAYISMMLTSHESFRLVQHPYVLVKSDSWKYFFIMRCRVHFSIIIFFSSCQQLRYKTEAGRYYHQNQNDNSDEYFFFEHFV